MNPPSSLRGMVCQIIDKMEVRIVATGHPNFATRESIRYAAIDVAADFRKISTPKRKVVGRVRRTFRIG
jgi:phosphoenolpyruvate carboxylase